MLFGPKFEKTVIISLSSKTKSKEFFGTLNQQQSLSSSPKKRQKAALSTSPIVSSQRKQGEKFIYTEWPTSRSAKKSL